MYQEISKFVEAETLDATLDKMEQSGELSPSFAQSMRKANMVLYENEWWAIGLETKKWHRWVDGKWEVSVPPTIV